MKRAIIQVVVMLAFAFPQIARAQEENAEPFRAAHQYTAKFICGYVQPEAGLGVLPGEYNTIINMIATKNDTALAYRVTPVSTDLETYEGEPSDFSRRFDLDQDWAQGIICRDIKRLLFVSGNEGLVEGFVTIYSQKPIVVSDVLTGGYGEGGVSTLHVHDVSSRRGGMRVTPGIDEK